MKTMADECKRKAIKEIIEMTSTIDPRDNSVWGMDTECGNIEGLIDSALEILKKHKITIKHGTEFHQPT